MYSEEVNELGFHIGGLFHKIVKGIKRVGKKIGKTVKKVANNAVHVAAGVFGGALGAAVTAADEYVSHYQQPSRPARPSYRPPQVNYTPSYRGAPPSTQGSSLQKYLPWILGGAGILLLVRGK